VLPVGRPGKGVHALRQHGGAAAEGAVLQLAVGRKREEAAEVLGRAARAPCKVERVRRELEGVERRRRRAAGAREQLREAVQMHRAAGDAGEELLVGREAQEVDAAQGEAAGADARRVDDGRAARLIWGCDTASGGRGRLRSVGL
jgi:hypothetical protein